MNDISRLVASVRNSNPNAADKSLGTLISDARNLSADDMERVAAYQRKHGLRFGEAAIALGFANAEDVLVALSQQFQYPYADAEQRELCPELVSLNQPFSRQAEAFRATRTQVLLRMHADRDLRKGALAVVSTDTGDGKTYLCANLAVSLAQLGSRVLVVDADMRGARLHQVFGVPNDTGLSSLLAGRGGLDVLSTAPGVPNLFVLPVGVQPPNPLELIEGQAFGLLLRDLATRFDHILLDTPASVFGSDGVVIAERCGNALVVARQDVNKVSALKTLTASLQAVQARITGVVINQF